MKTLMHFLRFG